MDETKTKFKEDMETRDKILMKRYGFNKSSYRYVPAGGELLKYIGQAVVRVYFKKNDEGVWDVSDTSRVFLKSIGDYDPATMTYECVWIGVEGDGDGKEHRVRIIPEGFSFTENGPEEAGEMERFIPYSMHCHLVEDEAFWTRLAILWRDRPTLSIPELQQISDSKDQGAILKYTNHIGVLVKLVESGNMLWGRIVSLSLSHKAGSSYRLRLETDQKDVWTMMIDSGAETYDFENGLGTFKIIDLRSA